MAARRRLLAEEKELTRRRDALNTARRELPMVRVDKEYAFEGPDGAVSLADLFGGRRQLIVQHAMFDPAWEEACKGCTASLDELSDGMIRHLDSRETTFVVVSRAPYPKLAAYKEKHGWTVPWFSSHGTDFNYDFYATADGTVAPLLVNFRTPQELTEHDGGWLLEGSHEVPGFSCFVRSGDEIYYTYATFARGTELTGDSYGLLDLTVLGRQEEWKRPAGRADRVVGADPSFQS